MSSLSPSPPGRAPSLVVRLALIAASCAVTACNTAPLPSLTGSPPVVATRWTALLTGKLVRVNGCLRVVDNESDTSYLLVWPPGQHTVNIEGDTIRVVDRIRGGGPVVWHIGQIVRLGGGEVSSGEYLDEQVRQSLPADCPGPYWIVGDVELQKP